MRDKILTLLLSLTIITPLRASDPLELENEKLAAIGVTTVVMTAIAHLNYDVIQKYCLTHPFPGIVPTKAEIEQEAARRGLPFFEVLLEKRRILSFQYEYMSCKKVKDEYEVTVRITYETKEYLASTPISVFVKKMPDGSFRVTRTHDPCEMFGFD
ncbi:MAG: hypothetical protein ABIM31_06855 [candidate division WOR-3 bacterium]